MIDEEFKKHGSYKYSVVSFLPDLIAGEDVNIGIEVHDMQTHILYKKYTKNVEEINRRYAFGHKGVEKMHELILSGFDKFPEVQQDKDYLLKKHEEPNNGYKRIFYSQPYCGLFWNEQSKCEDVLNGLYERFVIIDKKEERNDQ